MKYNPEKIKEICDHIGKGNSRNDACTLADINQDTFYVWMQKPEFSEAVKKAEIVCKSFHIENIVRHSEKSWQASAWWLERKHFAEFGLKQKEDHTVSPDAALRMAQTTLALMRELNASGITDSRV